jgi:hypothetical protein
MFCAILSTYDEKASVPSPMALALAPAVSAMGVTRRTGGVHSALGSGEWGR